MANIFFCCLIGLVVSFLFPEDEVLFSNRRRRRSSSFTTDKPVLHPFKSLHELIQAEREDPLGFDVNLYQQSLDDYHRDYERRTLPETILKERELGVIRMNQTKEVYDARRGHHAAMSYNVGIYPGTLNLDFHPVDKLNCRDMNVLEIYGDIQFLHTILPGSRLTHSILYESCKDQEFSRYLMVLKRVQIEPYEGDVHVLTVEVKHLQIWSFFHDMSLSMNMNRLSVDQQEQVVEDTEIGGMNSSRRSNIPHLPLPATLKFGLNHDETLMKKGNLGGCKESYNFLDWMLKKVKFKHKISAETKVKLDCKHCCAYFDITFDLTMETKPGEKKLRTFILDIDWDGGVSFILALKLEETVKFKSFLENYLEYWFGRASDHSPLERPIKQWLVGTFEAMAGEVPVVITEWVRVSVRIKDVDIKGTIEGDMGFVLNYTGGFSVTFRHWYKAPCVHKRYSKKQMTPVFEWSMREECTITLQLVPIFCLDLYDALPICVGIAPTAMGGFFSACCGDNSDPRNWQNYGYPYGLFGQIMHHAEISKLKFPELDDHETVSRLHWEDRKEVQNFLKLGGLLPLEEEKPFTHKWTLRAGWLALKNNDPKCDGNHKLTHEYCPDEVHHSRRRSIDDAYSQDVDMLVVEEGSYDIHSGYCPLRSELGKNNNNGVVEEVIIGAVLNEDDEIIIVGNDDGNFEEKDTVITYPPRSTRLLPPVTDEVIPLHVEDEYDFFESFSECSEMDYYRSFHTSPFQDSQNDLTYMRYNHTWAHACHVSYSLRYCREHVQKYGTGIPGRNISTSAKETYECGNGAKKDANGVIIGGNVSLCFDYIVEKGVVSNECFNNYDSNLDFTIQCPWEDGFWEQFEPSGSWDPQCHEENKKFGADIRKSWKCPSQPDTCCSKYDQMFDYTHSEMIGSENWDDDRYYAKEHGVIQPYGGENNNKNEEQHPNMKAVYESIRKDGPVVVKIPVYEDLVDYWEYVCRGDTPPRDDVKEVYIHDCHKDQDYLGEIYAVIVGWGIETEINEEDEVTYRSPYWKMWAVQVPQKTGCQYDCPGANPFCDSCIGNIYYQPYCIKQHYFKFIRGFNHLGIMDNVYWIEPVVNCSFRCYGVCESDEERVCSGHGECVGEDSCKCEVGYYGRKCSHWNCSGIVVENGENEDDDGKCYTRRGGCSFWSTGMPKIGHDPGVDSCNSVENCFLGGNPRECMNETAYHIWDASSPYILSPAERNVEYGQCCCAIDNVHDPGGFYFDDPPLGTFDFGCMAPNVCVCQPGYTGDHCLEFVGRVEVPRRSVQQTPLTCFGYRSDQTGVCSSHGTCEATDSCSCLAGYGGDRCQEFTCADIAPGSKEVCSGVGRCLPGAEGGECSCLYSGYSGENCEIFSCFGVDSTAQNTCSGNGECVAADTCKCEPGFAGKYCEQHTCFSKRRSNPQVCSGHGMCMSKDKCLCEENYESEDCSTWKCHGIDKDESDKVCSGLGYCVAPGVCVCSRGHCGPKCSKECNCEQFDWSTYTPDSNCEWTCGGISPDNPFSCSGHGICAEGGSCDCEFGYRGSQCHEFSCGSLPRNYPGVCSLSGVCVGYNLCRCVYGHLNANCSSHSCRGLPFDHTLVCSGRGECVGFDSCSCEGGFSGQFCEVDSDGNVMDPEEEGIWCFGYKSTNKDEVCSGNGKCTRTNVCRCSSNKWSGPACEIGIANAKLDDLRAFGAGHVVGIVFVVLLLCLASLIVLGIVPFGMCRVLLMTNLKTKQKKEEVEVEVADDEDEMISCIKKDVDSVLEEEKNTEKQKQSIEKMVDDDAGVGGGGGEFDEVELSAI